jgi:hypothetical protein
MRQTKGIAEVKWQVQDLRERLILAEAEHVKVIRLVREVVRHEPNRWAATHRVSGQIPLFADPADVLAALRRMGHLAYLARPGVKNRVRPGVLVDRWERTANDVEVLGSQLARLEGALDAADVKVRLDPTPRPYQRLPEGVRRAASQARARARAGLDG